MLDAYNQGVADRLMSKLTVTPGCWVWTVGTVHDGYGKMKYKGRMRFAHRIAYQLWVGHIPEGLVIDHLCRNRLCCNPAHLEAVTSKENTLRGESPIAFNARKTECHNGHPLEGDNLKIEKGRRRCRICHRALNAEYRRRQRVRTNS